MNTIISKNTALISGDQDCLVYFSHDLEPHQSQHVWDTSHEMILTEAHRIALG